MDDYDEEDEGDELRFLKPSQLGSLRQQALDANNARKVLETLLQLPAIIIK